MRTALRFGFPVVAALGALLLGSDSAQADAAGDKVLAAMDEAMNRAQTQSLEYDITTQEPGKPEVKQAITVRMKAGKRLTEYSAPADMKGTKVLVLSPTEMYVYLPAFGKVRRVASGTSDTGFMGMTFSLDDFLPRFGDLYTASVVSEAATQVKIAATPKAGQQTPYTKIEITIAKDRMLPTELKYFRAANLNVKNETRTNVTCQGNICSATELKMVDNTKSGMWTKLVRKTWKVNENLSDDLFTKRSLEK